MIVSQSFDNQHHSYITLPATVCWCIWLERNNLLFNCGSTIPQVVATKAMMCYNASKESQLAKTTSKIRALPWLQKIVGWFDGATGDGQNNGVGGVICINPNYLIKWTFNLGVGTNNRAELMGVWTYPLFIKNPQSSVYSNHWGFEAGH
jgi:hypothetical protein